MLNPYPIPPRLRANSNPPRPYTLYKQRQLEKEKQSSVDYLPMSQGSERGVLPYRPLRNPDRLKVSPFTDSHFEESSSIRNSSEGTSRDPGLPSPITSVTASARPSSSKQKPGSSPQPKLSTLDRAILRELQRSMQARSSQFCLKNDKKHHPFRPDQVPYPRSYDKQCVDFDVWDTVFCEQFCQSVTWHAFDPPPTKVLDLGCGTGSWILDCARTWKDCHFVGLDIVPLHPDLGHSDLGNRVKWVQANFLEPFPFPNEEFDFVHSKRIARGVPEDKWDFLFEEIARVMKPGGAIEVMEEDLYLPGRLRDTNPGSPGSSTATFESFSSVSDSGIHLTTPASNHLGQSSSIPEVGHSETDFPQTSAARFASDLVSNRVTDPRTGSARRPSTSGPQNRLSDSHFSLHSLISRIPALPELPPPPPPRQKGKSKDYLSSAGPGVSSAAFAYPAFGASLGFSSRPSQRAKSTRTPKRPSSPGVGRSGSSDAVKSPAAKSSRLSMSSLSSTEGQVSKNAKGKEKEIIHDLNSERTGQINRAKSLSYAVDGPSRAMSLGQWDSQAARDIHSFHTSGDPADTIVRTRSTFRSRLREAEAAEASKPLDRNTHSNTDTAGYKHVSSSTKPSPSSRSPPHITQLPTSLETKSSSMHPIYSSIPPPENPRDHRLLEIIYTEMHASRFVNMEPLSLLGNYMEIYFKDVRTHPPLIFTFPPSFLPSTPLDVTSIKSIAAARVEIDHDRIHDAAYDHDRESILSAPYGPNGSLADSVPRRFSTFSDSISLADSRRSVDIQPQIDSVPSLAKDFLEPTMRAASAVSRGNVIVPEHIITGTSEYVTFDKSRIFASSPQVLLSNSARAARSGRGSNSGVVEGAPGGLHPIRSQDTRDGSYPNGKEPEDAESFYRMRMVQQLGSFPNPHPFEVDIRTLNLHLRARVMEVLACAESMWDWVREFQRRENENRRGRMKGREGGLRKRAESARRAVTGNPPREVGLGSGTDASRGGVAGSMKGIGEHLEQDTKDELLAMTRERFDEMLMRFRFDMDDCTALSSAIKRLFEWPSYVPQRTDERTAFDLACSTWDIYEAARKGSSHDGGHSRFSQSAGDGRVGGWVDRGRDEREGKPEDPVPPVHPPSSQPHPSNRLSRTIRAFLAWKA